MKTHAWVWIDTITAAVHANDNERLTDIANALIQAERAKMFLRAKHYGQPGMALDVMAGTVLVNTNRSE